MRQIVSCVVVFLLSAGTSFAQEEWHEYTNAKDRFSVLFPGDPVVTDITWETEYGGKLPGHVYTVKKAGATYSVTVVDYNSLKEQQIAKGQNCEPGREGCTADTAARRAEPSGVGYWKTDIRGALAYTTFKYLQRNAKVTYYMWNFLGQGPEAYELQLLNPDKSRTFVAMYMHHNWLYVLDSTFPENVPPPIIFQQSIGLLEADGSRARHGRTYFNGAELDPDEVFPNYGAPAPAGR